MSIQKLLGVGVIILAVMSVGIYMRTQQNTPGREVACSEIKPTPKIIAFGDSLVC